MVTPDSIHQTLDDLQKRVEEQQGLLHHQIAPLRYEQSLLLPLALLISTVWIVLMSIPRVRDLIAALLLLPFAGLAAYGWLVILRLVPRDRS